VVESGGPRLGALDVPGGAAMKHRRFRPAPKPIEPACPAWCTRDHALDIDVEDMMVFHCRDLGNGVEVVAVDDLEAGNRTPIEVCVRATSCETAGGARRLALAILDAADYLDGAR
jgi:hypothetical protein